jgi:uncharacterized protein YbaR (Trm112 family)
MTPELLDLLRCPYCGGRLELVSALFSEKSGDRIVNGVLGCECCTFPVVDGIPVMHLQPPAVAARQQIEAANPAGALRAMAGVESSEQAERFEAAAASPASTYRDIVDTLGVGLEGGYFMYRFSDPTFIVADAVVRAVAGTALAGGGRALDVCGGSGHLTRSLLPFSSRPPLLADLFFTKLWLGRRFTAPGCLPVCCDGNGPLPLARGAFDLAMCCDAVMFLWHKRQFVSELFRAVHESPRATVLLGHAHSQLVWSPSHGDTLTPAGYRNLFETASPRVYGESRLFGDVVHGAALDLSRQQSDASLENEAALTLLTSRVDAVFAVHPFRAPQTGGGEWRINPLYSVATEGALLHGRLQFPSEDYEYEYSALREYLPDDVFIDANAFTALRAGSIPSSLDDLIRRRVIVELPKQYY